MGRLLFSWRFNMLFPIICHIDFIISFWIKRESLESVGRNLKWMEFPSRLSKLQIELWAAIALFRDTMVMSSWRYYGARYSSDFSNLAIINIRTLLTSQGSFWLRFASSLMKIPIHEYSSSLHLLSFADRIAKSRQVRITRRTMDRCWQMEMSSSRISKRR